VLGNGSEEDVLGVGTYRLTLKGGNKLLLFDALYAPGVRTCLLSLVSLMKSSFGFSSCHDGLNILYCGNVFGHAILRNDFLVLDLDESYNNSHSVFVSHFDSDLESIKWHAGLSHIGQDRMSWLAKEGLLDQFTKVKLPKYESCLAGKATAKPFGKALRASSPLELIQSAICGPMKVKSRHRAFYFLTFIDDYSRYGYVYLLSYRYEAFDVFKRFVGEVET